MYIVATFRHSSELELAICELERQGILAEAIAAVPLRANGPQEIRVFDTIRRSDGVSLLDGPAVTGTIGSVLGAALGFGWAIGPIFGGLLGLASGAALGFALDWLINFKRRKKRKRREHGADVVMIVECSPDQASEVRHIMERWLALGIGQLGSG
ncbi:hypothetical protein [Paenibacillus ehimensis]|uniref:DUF1269 domain-containing protein n=1 Tax=Paenibacillus ehimensis TaxID=79264 RepID=A0ABT8VE99_9BACL|nr:hypothetical protein [Paenibacillus ehimensis]MDO3679302.1 hypothetical protein [Paenibacillus ehimensis]